MRKKSKNNPMFEKITAKGSLFLLVTLTISILSPSLTVLAVEMKDAEFVVEGLQKRYNSTLDFVADFRQETELKALNRTLTAWGKVYFRRPGKMLWRYAEPKGQVLLADGEYLYFYQPEEKQVIKSRFSSASHLNTPLSFLLGMGDLKRDFTATLVNSEQKQYVVRLAPNETIGGMADLLLGVEIEEFDFNWAQIKDAVGNVTTIRFSEMQRGVGLEDSIFRLEVPNEIDIVEIGS